jgi:hypothetical protein
MTDPEFTPLEQHFLDASARPEVTVRRRRLVIIWALALVASITVAAILPVSRTFFVVAFAAYVLITLREKVAYANGVLVYKSVIRKLLARPKPAEPSNSDRAA